MPRSLLVFTALLITASFGTSVAEAQCTCSPTWWEATTAFESADAVFVGEVVSKTEIDQGYAVTLDIREVWKGEVDSRMTVQDTICLVGYREEAQYLVYAHGSEETLYAGMCTRSMPLEMADDDLDAFRSAGIEPRMTR